jgi:hypothetical protein
MTGVAGAGSISACRFGIQAPAEQPATEGPRFGSGLVHATGARPPQGTPSEQNMLGFLKAIFGRAGSSGLRVEAYWCESPITLPRRVKTPLGGSVSVVTVCVDIDYAVENGCIIMRRVELSRGGGMMGSSTSLNVAASNRGEAWYATRICPDSTLLQAVQADLGFEDSRLRRIMIGKWRDANRGPLVHSIAEALNSRADPKEIASLVLRAGRGNSIEFTYTKPDGSSSLRRVSVQGISGKSLRARDHKDGEVKSFRLDRITGVRALR